MKLYVTMKKDDMFQSVTVVNEFLKKFPTSSLRDFHWESLAKYYKLPPKQLKGMAIFCFYLQMRKAQVDLTKLKEMKIKNQKNKWQFILIQEENDKTIQLDFEEK